MPLAEFFREIANRELECDVIGFDGEARKTLLTHAWPGNVRELRQKIMGAVLQAQTGLVTKEHLELAVCNLQIFLCLFLEKLNMPQNTPVTKAS